ncbi:MAG: NGG1p interacting factor NIF3, partial [Thermodesulfovibrionales bacterium]|nr:NGG1p interacting factor NIF3 [Thermodesulfovibrionales bacterium]
MRLGNLYRKAVATGIENDPRGKTFVLQELDRRKKEFNKLNPDERDFFDSESLENPYSDSRILVGDEDSEVITIFAGIDIDVGEILLADTLRTRGKKIDLLLSHHPSG